MALQIETERVELLRSLAELPDSWESDLVHAGIPVPFQHRSAWLRAGQTDGWCVLARSGDGEVTCGLVASVGRTRALPGHRLLRVERFGAARTAAGRRAALEALAEAVRADRRVLAVHVETFSRDAGTRADVGNVLEELGFQRVAVPRHYPVTVVVDLTPDEDALFGSFRPTARQNVRVVQKHPVEVRAVNDERYADRLNALLAEAMSRTAGHAVSADWRRILAVSRTSPELSRVAGLFRTDREAPDDLLAFAWGRMHGDHAEYSLAAGTRQTDLRIPLAYVLVWDLMRWARSNGAGWWDFGGVTAGTAGSGDALGGISDFKRRFSKEVVAVGDEWMLEPHPSRARVAHWLRRAATGLKGG